MGTGLLKLIMFGAISVGLLYISRKSLLAARSHGFYRFFAWEVIVALVLINVSRWFFDPFSLRQIASWIFLCVSLLMLWMGVYRIRVEGKSSDQRQDAILLPFEKTSVLVTSGIYRYIRHPLYSSLLFLAWGVLLKDITWQSVCLVGAATVCLIATAITEEAECIRYFGSPYTEYMSRTRMFIPFLF